MRRRQFISGDEAVPCTRQITKPCSDCPFARTALQGWLGNLSAYEWVEASHGEAFVDCHTS